MRESRPTLDPIALSVAAANVAEVLFGTSGLMAHVGRFRLLDRVGSGGVGIVYTAYDPDLDRAVALKLVRVAESGRPAALAEAKALAQLSHPNVVPVHDVGIIDEHVFIVMELVRGQTLAQWIRQARPSHEEVKTAYLQAAHALEAAHAKGLVHRDFKPENAIVGDDGRVRVIDFGLASAAGTTGQGGRAVGTPRYMAPEQGAGLAATPAVDQYSFSTAMLEALAQVGPVPRWLETTLNRGCARDPAARFESMPALIRGLSRDPSRARWQRVAFAAIALSLTAAFFAGRAIFGAHADVCSGAQAAIAETWGPEGRAGVLARLETLGSYGKATAARIEKSLAAYEAKWAAHHREACLTHRRGEQSDAHFDRRMACLSRARVALGAIAETVRVTQVGTLPQLVAAVPSLPEPDQCADAEAMFAEVTPPSVAQAPAVAELRSQISRGQILVAASRYEDAKREVTAAVARARTVGYAPALAESLFLLGELYFEYEREDAITPLTEALTLALASGANRLAVKAWAVRAYAIGTVADPTTAMNGFEVIEPMASRDPAPSYARVLLYNGIGAVAMSQGKPEVARPRYRRALEESRGLVGNEAAMAVKVRSNLAVTLDDLSARDAMLAEAVAVQTRLLGEDHPRTLLTVMRRGSIQRGLRALIALDAPVCERFETLHPARAEDGLSCWTEVGLAYDHLGERDRAVAAMAHGNAFGSRPPEWDAIAIGYHELWSGRPREAAARFAKAFTEYPVPADEPWWNAVRRGRLALGLGEAEVASGNPVASQAALRKAVVLLTPPAEIVFPSLDRNLMRARAELAKSLAQSRTDRAFASELAKLAAAYLRLCGGDPLELERLEKIAR